MQLLENNQSIGVMPWGDLFTSGHITPPFVDYFPITVCTQILTRGISRTTRGIFVPSRRQGNPHYRIL